MRLSDDEAMRIKGQGFKGSRKQGFKGDRRSGMPAVWYPGGTDGNRAFIKERGVFSIERRESTRPSAY
ncbi:MAG: hypothetical protein DSY90_15170 [Deltaproteobacteria bacterium]|nr:MAG: hypothetical protein DSY90_15170 [Deltaproteobacteria bacterium]